MKKILLLIPQNIIPAVDGGKQSIFYPMKIISKYYEVRVIVFVGEKEARPDSDYLKINVQPYFLETDKSDNPLKLLINIFQEQPFKFNRYFSKLNIKEVLSICSSYKPHLVICHHAHLAYYGKIIKQNFSEIKLILREHNIEYLIVKQFALVKKNWIIKLISYWQYKKVKKVETKSWDFFNKTLFISNSDIEEAKKNINSCAFELLHDGAHIVERTFQKKEEIVLFTGNLSALQNEYNLNYFIKNIWIPFRKNNPKSNLKLLVTGNSDDFFERKTNLNSTWRKEYNIENRGFIENLTNIIQSAKYFLSPTIIGAGIRLKVLEAACNGCVILCTPIDYNMLPFFRDMDNVVLYHNYSSFIEKITILNNDDNLYNEISHNIYEIAKKYLDWNKFQDKYVHIIEKIF